MSDLSPAPRLTVYGRMDRVLLLFTVVVTHLEAPINSRESEKQ